MGNNSFKTIDNLKERLFYIESDLNRISDIFVNKLYRIFSTNSQIEFQEYFEKNCGIRC